MKKAIFLILLGSFIMVSTTAQVTFSVKPGFQLNSANIGYKIEKINPYIGFQHYGITRRDSTIYGIETSREVVSLNVSMPYVGTKYEIIRKESLVALADLAILKPIIHGRAIFDGEPDESLNEELKSISIWGTELSFACEYYFAESFSIGGGFGYRFGIMRMKDEDIARDRIDIMTNLLNTTFTSLSLNFYL